MIPKIIHFCWMSGDPYPELIEKCIQSWRNKLPDYKIVKWDSSNFRYQDFLYAKEAMDKKRYAFVSDILRLYALYNYGGIYLDSDIEVLKSFNSLLHNKAFTGFESDDRIGVWLLASEKGNPIFKEMLDCYQGKHFIKENGEMDLTPNPVILGPVFDKYGLQYNNERQELENITIYPKDYFCPLDGSTGELNITDNSYAMHLFNGAWKEKIDTLFDETYKKTYQALPDFLGNLVKDKLSKTNAALRTGGMHLFLGKLHGYLEKKLKG